VVVTSVPTISGIDTPVTVTTTTDTAVPTGPTSDVTDIPPTDISTTIIDTISTIEPAGPSTTADIPAVNSTTSTTGFEPTTTTIELPQTITTTTLNGNNTATTTTIIEEDGPTTIEISSTTTTASGETTTTSVSESSTIVQVPTTTLPETLTWLPTTLVIEVPPTTTEEGTLISNVPTSTASGIPTEIPLAITPNEGIPDSPEGSTLIRIGFEYGYNYPFVADNPKAGAQIFGFLPIGLAYGLNIPTEKIVMRTLEPFDARGQPNGFIKTLAYAYIPSDLVDALILNLHTPNSKLYNSDNESVWKLMGMIDPTISGRASDTMTGGSIQPVSGGDGNGGTWLEDGAGSNPDSTDDKTSDEDDSSFLGTSEQGEPKTITKTGAGIGVGIFVSAAAYGAAVFYIARRYRKRKLRHGRASSISHSVSPGNNPTSALMAGAPSMSMAGARYDTIGADKRGSNTSGGIAGGRTSARGQTISGPMQAENSLGWN